MHNLFLNELIIIITASVLVTAIFRYLKMSPTLSYLVVGVMIGPTGFGWITMHESFHGFSVFGVVFLLFILGLHFSLPKLVAMRRSVLLLGGAQVLVCVACFFVITKLAGYATEVAIILSGALALSSTAVVLKELSELRQTHTRHGHLALSILLFQDLAAVFFIVTLPLLGQADVSGSLSLVSMTFFKAVVLICGFLLFGKYLLPHIFNEITKAKSEEMFVLANLVIVLAAAWVTHHFGLSHELGAFMAGMMLSESHYRHQIEADIRPFKDVLLGLFFVSVGMSIDFNFFIEYWKRILFFSICLVGFKSFIIACTAKLLKERAKHAIRTGIVLSQGSEFGFALITLALSENLLSSEVSSFILSIIVISMAMTPFLVRRSESFTKHILKAVKRYHPDPEASQAVGDDLADHVVICGYGHVGQDIARFLARDNTQYSVVDNDSGRIQALCQAGEAAIYATSLQEQPLKAAHIESARLVVMCFDDANDSLKMTEIARQLTTDVPILVVTHDDAELDALMDAGATEVVPETLEASLMTVAHVFALLKVPAVQILKRIQSARQQRYAFLHGYFVNEDEMLSGLGTGGNKILHAVHLVGKAKAIGKQIKDLDIHKLGIEIQAIQRGDARISGPSESEVFQAGDVILIYGAFNHVEAAEETFLIGR